MKLRIQLDVNITEDALEEELKQANMTRAQFLDTIKEGIASEPPVPGSTFTCSAEEIP